MSIQVLSFYVYIFFVYVVGFVPLLFEEANLIMYGYALSLHSADLLVYFIFPLFIVPLLVYPSAWLSRGLFRLVDRLRASLQLSRVFFSIFFISVISYGLIGLFLVLIYGSNYRHNQLSGQSGLYGILSALLIPLAYSFVAVYTVYLATRTIKPGSGSRTFADKRLYLAVSVGALSLTALSAMDLIPLVPSIIVLVNPQLSHRIFSFHRSILYLRSFLVFLFTPLILLLAVLYSFVNKSHDISSSSSELLFLEAFARLGTHAQSLLTYVTRETMNRYQPFDLLAHRLCVLQGSNCGQHILTASAVNYLNTQDPSRYSVYAGSSPGLLASFFLPAEPYILFLLFVYLWVCLSACFVAIRSSCAISLDLLLTKPLLLIVVLWSCYTVFYYTFVDPLDALSIASPGFFHPLVLILIACSLPLRSFVSFRR